MPRPPGPTLRRGLLGFQYSAGQEAGADCKASLLWTALRSYVYLRAGVAAEPMSPRPLFSPPLPLTSLGGRTNVTVAMVPHQTGHPRMWDTGFLFVRFFSMEVTFFGCVLRVRGKQIAFSSCFHDHMGRRNLKQDLV